MSQVKVGDIMPLSICLHDGKSGMNISADIFNKFGDLLQSVALSNTQGGLYVNTNEVMPDLDYVIINYRVNDSDDYEMACERFDAIKLPTKGVKYIVGQVVKKTQKKFYNGTATKVGV